MIALLAIVAVNVAVSLVALRALGGQGPWRPETFLFIPYQVARGENGLGLLLAHFAHGGLLHLGFNMLALYTFAGPVLAALGPAKFVLVYVVAGLGSDLVVFALRRDEPSYRCLGASGSVFGVMTTAIVVNPSTSVAFVFLPVPIPGPLFMIGYAIVSTVLIARDRRGGVSHEGHLGGAVMGLALAGVLSPLGLGPLMQWFARWF